MYAALSPLKKAEYGLNKINKQMCCDIEQILLVYAWAIHLFCYTLQSILTRSYLYITDVICLAGVQRNSLEQLPPPMAVHFTSPC